MRAPALIAETLLVSTILAVLVAVLFSSPQIAQLETKLVDLLLRPSTLVAKANRCEGVRTLPLPVHAPTWTTQPNASSACVFLLLQ